MEICILGLDALEYDLVEKWNLENLKQEEYGKVEVPISEDGQPHSVQVWGSFLKGKLHGEDGFEDDNILAKIARWTHNNVIRNTGLWVSIKTRFGIKSKNRNFPQLQEKTLLDEGFEYKNAPFYNYIGLDDYNEKTLKFSAGRISTQEMKQFLNERLKKEISILKEGLPSDMFFGYIHTIDLIQHNLYTDENYLKNKYKEANEFVGKVKEEYSPNLLIVISDHGTDMEGKHSNHGFYSANKKLGLQNPHITDFYDIIMEKLGLPTKKDRENIKKNLEELGYIES